MASEDSPGAELASLLWGEDAQPYSLHRQLRMQESQPELEWVPAAGVRPGDRLAFLLADAQAFCEVAGWTDGEYDLRRDGLGIVPWREFTVRSAPWWVDVTDVRHSLDREALIVRREPGQRVPPGEQAHPAPRQAARGSGQ